MNSEITDDVREMYIKNVKDEQDSWIYIGAIACVAAYIILLKSLDVAGGWWILLWSFIGFLLLGVVSRVLEVLTRTEEKLRNSSDEVLSGLVYKVKQKDSAKKRRGQFLFLLSLAFFVSLFWTNPDEKYFAAKLNETTELFSSAYYKNLFLFSLHHEKSTLTGKNTLYVGILNRVFYVPL